MTPCKRGHSIESRYLNNRGHQCCRACQAEYSRKWEKANHVHRRRYHRLYAYVRRGLLDEAAIMRKLPENA